MKTNPKPAVRAIHGQKSWVTTTSTVEMAVTQLGGHLAPVVFGADSDPFQPYYISPWQGERGVPAMPCPCLAPLRGDFFCLPFGGNGTPYRGERHPPHGETSGSLWKLEACTLHDDITELTTSLVTKTPPP